jgi:hypothetical protein
MDSATCCVLPNQHDDKCQQQQMLELDKLMLYTEVNKRENNQIKSAAREGTIRHTLPRVSAGKFETSAIDQGEWLVCFVPCWKNYIVSQKLIFGWRNY